MKTGGFLRHVEALNSWNPQNFSGFYHAGVRVGYLKPPMLAALQQWPDYFLSEASGLALNPALDSFETRTQALSEVTAALVDQGVISHAHGERYPVTAGTRDCAIATIDRTAATYFGLRAYGQHLNGYVETGRGLMLWIARRAADRRVYPGKLDNMVAGGLPYDLGLKENLRKECMEEASVPADLASRATPVGALTYCKETATGLKPDTLYCYDLRLPEAFQPRNTDGEVAEFRLLPVQEVVHLVRESDDFKLNCNLVLIDFFVRHGILDPESPDYLSLVAGLHEKF